MICHVCSKFVKSNGSKWQWTSNLKSFPNAIGESVLYLQIVDERPPIHPVRKNCLIHSFTGWAMPVMTQLSSGGTAEAMILGKPSCPRLLLQGRVRRLGEPLEAFDQA